MTATINVTVRAASAWPNRVATQVVNGLLSIKPLADFAKTRARQMIIKRAEAIGVAWRDEVKLLKSRGTDEAFSPQWEADLAAITNPHLQYPEYYLTSFHAYDVGNMSWDAAMEVEVAAYSVHARIFDTQGKDGDASLRQSYHDLLTSTITTPPQRIVDIGCSVGMSSFALQEIYPDAQITGVDLSPYFLAVANYRSQSQGKNINWVHAAGEATGLADGSCDLVSMFLICHELPQAAMRQIFREARRILAPHGHIAIMDMNPQSPIYGEMPPYVLTLLKSTEPYLDEYFTFDIAAELVAAGFQAPTITANSPRHRTVIAHK
jgi:ubiquinone/menaquinone biosynthesis C-methylase UbiE